MKNSISSASHEQAEANGNRFAKPGAGLAATLLTTPIYALYKSTGNEKVGSKTASSLPSLNGRA